MTASLTNYGQRVALHKDNRNAPLVGTPTGLGGIIKVATRIKLYTSASVPGKADSQATPGGGAFIEVANGNGYTTAGLALIEADWTYSVVGGNAQYQLTDKQWNAIGGQVLNVAGAFITDADGNVMAWWERGSTVTLNDGESIKADDFVIRMA